MSKVGKLRFGMPKKKYPFSISSSKNKLPESEFPGRDEPRTIPSDSLFPV